MPDGSPIDQWWKSQLPPRSTSASKRVCAANRYGIAYCGTRRNAGVSTNPAAVTCADCQAAIAADQQPGDPHPTDLASQLDRGIDAPTQDHTEASE